MACATQQVAEADRAWRAVLQRSLGSGCWFQLEALSQNPRGGSGEILL